MIPCFPWISIVFNYGLKYHLEISKTFEVYSLKNELLFLLLKSLDFHI